MKLVQNTRSIYDSDSSYCFGPSYVYICITDHVLSLQYCHVSAGTVVPDDGPKMMCVCVCAGWVILVIMLDSE